MSGLQCEELEVGMRVEAQDHAGIWGPGTIEILQPRHEAYAIVRLDARDKHGAILGLRKFSELRPIDGGR